MVETGVPRARMAAIALWTASGSMSPRETERDVHSSRSDRTNTTNLQLGDGSNETLNLFSRLVGEFNGNEAADLVFTHGARRFFK